MNGGPIRSNSYVRIYYDPSGNVILRLEIRDFKGELKDYTKPVFPFPGARDIGNVNGKPPATETP